MELSRSDKIAQYAKDNPLASKIEIKNIFGVSRQLVSQVLNSIYTKEEMVERKSNRLNVHFDAVKQSLKDKKSFTKICEELSINKNKLNKIIEANPELAVIIAENEKTAEDRVEQMSIDWCNKTPIATMMKKYNIGITSASAASYISKLRDRHGIDKFPLRLDNQMSLEEKALKYDEYVLEGKTPEEICTLLGYKNLASMRTSIAFLHKDKK